MEEVVSENLFLLEFLVDKVNLYPNAIPEESLPFCQETCVCFQFLDNSPLDICEADFEPKREYEGDGGLLKNGKSCLFSLTADQAQDATTVFDVNVGVFKKMNGILPEKFHVGTAQVDVSGMFLDLVKSLKGKKGQPAAKTIKDVYPIVSGERGSGSEVGTVGVFLRMSCFGKLIVTQFQMNLEDKSVLFKDQEGNALYRYRKVGKVGEEDGEVTKSPGSQSRPNQGQRQDDAQGGCSCGGPKSAYRGGAPQDPSSGSFQHMQQYLQQQQMLQQGCCPAMMYQQQQGYGNGQPPFCPAVGGGGNGAQSDQSCYQEIGAEMAGNALKIRVHKDPKTAVQRMGDGGEWMPQEGVGVCPYGQGQGTAMSMAPGYGNITPAMNPVALKMAACPDALQDNNVTVIPPCPTGQDQGLAQVVEIPNPTKDVFVLRIGKKTEGNDKKSNLELELQTPKGIERKPPAKKETRETQCEDLGEPAKKGKGGKGKKGKGGKGGGKKGGKGGKKKK